VILNPEFRRNLWIELRLHRLLVMPIVVAIVAALLISLDETFDMLRYVALAGFYGVVYIWGSRRAAAAVSDEVNARTWEMQRMTALGAWQMTWGKLFGSTVFVWYGGLQILALLVFASVAGGARGLDSALADAGLKVAAGVLVHAVAVMVSLVLLAKRPRSESLPVTFSQMIGLVAVLGVENLPQVGLAVVPRLTLDSTAVWYGFSGTTEGFALASLIVFAGWAVFGVYRLMRAELQFEGAPWGWPLFVLFTAAYLSGFLPAPAAGDLKPWLMIGFSLSVIATYIAIFAENNGPLRYRGLLAAARRGRPLRLLYRLPRWLPVYLLLLFCMLALLATSDFTLLSFGTLELRYLESEIGRLSRFWIAALALFALRDIFFVLTINALGRDRRPDLTAFIYLVLLYGPVTWLLQFVAPQFAGLLAAVPGQAGVVSVVSAAVQALLLGAFLIRAWQRPAAPPRAERRGAASSG
jgi:hypothetical protein